MDKFQYLDILAGFICHFVKHIVMDEAKTPGRGKNNSSQKKYKFTMVIDHGKINQN